MSESNTPTSDMCLYYSIFSGTIYEVFPKEVPNLDEGQIPLKKRPSQSCKTCFGRGYTHEDKSKGVYPVCKCLKKCIIEGYQPTQIRILPKLD